MDRRAKREIVVARKRQSVVAKKTVAKGGRVIGGTSGDDSIRHWFRGVLFGSEIWRAEKRWMACQRWPAILEMGVCT